MNDASGSFSTPKPLALVLAGGIAMGAFEAGAYAALHEAGQADRLRWVAGSSIGAVTAALIAGTRAEDRVAQLDRFWRHASFDPTPLVSFWFGPPGHGAWRQAYNQASVLETLWLGRPGLFRPRLFRPRLQPAAQAGAQDVPALYDLEPLREHLGRVVDFGLLNRGNLRVTLTGTDVVTGERVVFDTARGCVIGPQHVVASCALLPLFAPVEIDGRLIADGGLASNAPIDLVVSDPAARGLRCLLVDLFARQGSRPHTLAASAARAGDLAFGNQSRRQLEAGAREDRLRALIGQLGDLLPPDLRQTPEVAAILAEGRNEPADVHTIAYRAGLDEAGLGKPFDFSAATIADRWRAGEEGVAALLEILADPR